MCLPSKKEYFRNLKPLENPPQDPNCPICREHMLKPTQTACNHIFCYECLRSWAVDNNSCPICFTELYDEYDSSLSSLDDDSDDSEDGGEDGDSDDEKGDGKT
ncbi:hypothetical protein CERZMDRAFT_102232 [Cercospora zeae-maydis SCOH1-5]|uniref:RING-type domain-containing protein n=1 Tax=Cercospora zeae-maydis SCOH1-5 TaxID=717836 RepID=A0A6A6F318_9PEZI|nr:hypothetical protein CERZMDRAFT_102232 [Cercospora zeae-maydis SCOH1-5]